MRHWSGLVLFNIFCFTLVYSAKFPQNWTKCPKTGDNEECLNKAIQEAIVSLKEGNKGLSIMPLDPLHLDRLNIEQGSSSPVNVNLTFFDIDVTGISTLQVSKSKIDWGKKIVFVVNLTEPLTLLGDYSITGKVLLLPIQGEGKANITMENFGCLGVLEGNLIEKDSKQYFDITKGTFTISAKRCHIWLGNLFNGIPNLGDNMNKFLNENWKEIIDELSGPITVVLGQVIQQIGNVFFHKVPINYVYTD